MKVQRLKQLVVVRSTRLMSAMNSRYNRLEVSSVQQDQEHMKGSKGVICITYPIYTLKP